MLPASLYLFKLTFPFSLIMKLIICRTCKVHGTTIDNKHGGLDELPFELLHTKYLLASSREKLYSGFEPGHHDLNKSDQTTRESRLICIFVVSMTV